MAKQREPFQVSPVFAEKMRELQRAIRMANGLEKSLRDLTEEITKTPAFEELKRKLAEKKKNHIRMSINFDGKIA